MATHKIIDIRSLTEYAYVLRFERNGLEFVPGQHIYVGIPNDDDRPYSVYSGLEDNYLEILVKEIDKGNVSKKLKQLQQVDYVTVGDARGHFCIDEQRKKGQQMIFIATGTGIAPFHCFVRSYRNLDYRLIHGVRHRNEAYDAKNYDKSRYVLCTSQDDASDSFHGRVNDYLKSGYVDAKAFYFLCGNSLMIDEVYDMLEKKGVPHMQIRSEMYF